MQLKLSDVMLVLMYRDEIQPKYRVVVLVFMIRDEIQPKYRIVVLARVQTCIGMRYNQSIV